MRMTQVLGFGFWAFGFGVETLILVWHSWITLGRAIA